MNPADPSREISITQRRYALSAILWTAIVLASGLWNAAETRKGVKALAHEEASAMIRKDLSFRTWIASHGGVYVAPDAITPPNPYLDFVPDRDVETTDGKKLTLMNPAYVTRQLHEHFTERFGIKAHITSLRPINPGNAPHAWEREALLTFEAGNTREVETALTVAGQPYYGLVRALVTERECLRCHERHGYKVGDIRGALSVMVPLAPYLKAADDTLMVMAASHGAIWLLVLGGIAWAGRRATIRVRENIAHVAALAESRQLFQTVADYSATWIYWRNPDGSFRYISKNCEEVSGYTAEEFQHDADLFVRIAHAEDRERWSRHVRDAETGNHSHLIEFRIVTKQGEIRNINHICRPIFDEAGGFVGVSGSNADVTAFRENERQLAERTAELDQLFQTLPDLYFRMERDGTLLDFRAGHGEDLYMPPAEFVGKRVRAVLPPAVAAKIEAAIAAIDAGQAMQAIEYTLPMPGGEKVFEARLLPLGTRQVVAVVRNVSERVQAQQALQESYDRMSHIQFAMDRVGIGIAWNDMDTGRYIYVNDEACRQVGYTREEYLQLVVGDINPSVASPAAKDAALEALANGRRLRLETEHRRKDGSTYPVEVTCYAYQGGTGKVMLIAFHQDITERRRQEEELRQKDALLHDQSRLAAMGEMIGNIAHQWRQPLSVLALVVQNLKYDLKEGRIGMAEVEESVARAMKTIEQMSATIDDFRNFFKPLRQPEQFSPLRTIHDCNDLVGASLAAHGIALGIAGPADFAAYGYPSEFAQIVLNLISNSKDAIVERGITDGRIDIAIAAGGRGFVVTVQDNAGGIALDHVDRIFDPYFTTKEKGTGIGLYMTRTIVEQHMHGTIEAGNAAHGLRFTIDLPTNLAAGNPEAGG